MDDSDDDKDYQFDDNMFSDIPETCIDPQDPKTFDAFVAGLAPTSMYNCITQDTFSYQPPLPSTGLKLSPTPLLELYSVRILKLHPSRKTLSVYLACSSTHHIPLIVFDGELAQGMSIPFRGPIRPSDPEQHLVLSLTNPQSPGWCFVKSGYGNPAVLEEAYDTVFKQVLEDELTDSRAVIHYQIIKSAVCAELQFVFTGTEKFSHEIISGCISARDDTNRDTERVIHMVTKHPSSPKFSVNRYVFGVPVGSKLVVSFKKFAYIKYGINRLGQTSQTVELPTHTVTFDAQTKSCLKEKFFMIAGRKLRVRVSWCEPR